MSPEAQKPIESTKPELKNQLIYFANRRFERFMMGINPGFRLDALRPDQRGSYYPFEIEQFRRGEESIKIDPEEGKLIATITFGHENKTTTTEFVDEGSSGKIVTPSQSK